MPKVTRSVVRGVTVGTLPLYYVESVTSVAEGTASPNNLVVVFRRTGSTAAVGNFTYTVAAGSGLTPADSGDLAAGFGTTFPASFSAGQAAVTVNLATVNDAISEYNESVLVAVTPNPAYRSGISLEAYILDDDTFPVVSISPVSSVSNGGTFSVTFNRDYDSGVLAFSYTVSAITTDNADLVAGAGAYGTFNTQFDAGSVTKTITIATVNNPTGEVDETFGIALEPSAAYTVDPLADSVVCTIIGPPALPTVSIKSYVSGIEGSTDVSVTFTRTGSTAATLDLTYRIAAGTGGGLTPITSSDIVGGNVPFNRVITFQVGNADLTDTIQVVDDLFVEATKGMDVSIVSQPLLYTIGAPSLVTVPIYDNEPPGPQYEPTTLQTSHDFDGVTFYFNKSMPCGRFVDGSPFVVSNVLFDVTGTSPASAIVGGFAENGMMFNTDVTLSSGPQGLDQRMSLVVGSGTNGVSYSSALNVDPGNTGVPISFAAGASAQLIKSVHVPGRTGANWQHIDRYVVLTILPTYPLAAPFRPSLKKTSNDIPAYESQINYDVLRNFTAVSGGYSLATGLAVIPKTMAPFPTGGDPGRKWRTDDALGGSDNYGRDIGNNRLKAFHALHTNATPVQKRDLMIRCIQAGIDATTDTGIFGTSGAGQWHGTLWMVYLAAFALGDATLLAACKGNIENMNGQHRWCQQFMIGQPTSWPGNHQVLCGTWFDELLDVPVWRPDTITSPTDKVNSDENSYPTADYRTQSCGPGPMEMFCTLLLQNGPGGATGVSALLDGGAFDKTNHKAAPIAYMDLHRAYNSLFSSGAYPAGHRAFYDAYRDTAFAGTPIASRYTNQPETLDFTGGDLVTVSATAGGFSWAFAAGAGTGGGGPGTTVGATEVITSVDMRYSLDQRAWKLSSGVVNSGLVSGLIIGQTYWVQFRRWSASGASPWSPNHKRYSDDTATAPATPERRDVVPTGTGVNAQPANAGGADLPVVTVRKYPFWAGPSWEVSGSPVDETQNILYAGVGHWTGFPAPTFTYQWQRGGVDIAGAITDYYLATAADVAAGIRVVVTASNGQGAPVSATSAAVTIPTGTGKVGTYIPIVRAAVNAVAASTANLTLSGLQTVDTVAVTAGQYVLAKNQTAPAENALYAVAAGAWTRVAEADTWNEMVGLRVNVTGGSQATSQGGTSAVFASDAAAGGTLGTTAVNFVARGIAPPNMTKRWDALSASPIPLYCPGNSDLVFGQQTTTTAAIRFWSLDFLQPLGVLSAVSEGVMTLKTSSADPTLANQRFGMVCRASGAAADGSTATGYYLEYTIDGSGSYLNCYKYSNSATPTTITATTGSGTLLHSTGNIQSANTEVFAKFQFVMSGTTLILRAKVWKNGNAEPGWQAEYQDVSPHAAGWVGIGTRASRGRRTFRGGISLDITPSITNSTQEESSLANALY